MMPNFNIVSHNLAMKNEFQQYKTWFRANVDALKEQTKQILGNESFDKFLT